MLKPGHKIDAFGSLTIPEFVLKRDSPTSSIALDGQFKFAEYFNHSELDSDSQLFNLKLSKDLSERSTVSFQGDFNRDTTLTSDEDLTGRFLTEPVRFITWDAAPTWSYQLSPIVTLTRVGTAGRGSLGCVCAPQPAPTNARISAASAPPPATLALPRTISA